MATYEWAELISLWRRERVDEVQMIGHLLQHGQATHEMALVCQRQQRVLEQQVSALEQQVALLVKRLEALEASQAGH